MYITQPLRAEYSELLARYERPGQPALSVFQQGQIHWISEDGITAQSAMLCQAPAQLPLAYLQVMATALLFAPSKAKALNLGLGGGALVRFVSQYTPAIEVHSVERSAPMAELCRQHFQLPADHQVFIENADSYLSANRERYSLIFADLPITTLEQSMLFNCRRVLSSNGVVAFNLFFEQQQQLVPVINQIRSLFPAVMLLPVDSQPNLVVLAFNDAQMAEDASLPQQAAKQLTMRTAIDFNGILASRVPMPALE